LNIGTVEPRKNIDRLLNAWLSLPPDVIDAFDLVIAGPAGWKSDSTLARLRESSKGVRYLGYVDEQDLPALTAGAVAHAYPSLYEGFGFPLAQAMACGVPSITSNVSSMPEVAAGSALLVDPHSESEIREALLKMLTSATLRAQLGGIGKLHALQHYTWEQAARQSWDFFERVVA
jgi:alpha-1,3-rhamnosyl/mannosyltransferase